MNPIELSLFSSRIEAVCEEMGAVLRRTAFSPNIKDRLDYSCAVFDANGQLSAQAAHIPVHLGSMAYAMADIVSNIRWQPCDMVVLNDPFLGGTHLPDVTVIAPVFVSDDFGGQHLVAFVANRAHHANIGSDSPGSMPIATTLAEEGEIIAPCHLVKAGDIVETVMAQLSGDNATESGAQMRGDFLAQISANLSGRDRLEELIKKTGISAYQSLLHNLNLYAERLARKTIEGIPNGLYEFKDYLDDDGCGQANILIAASVKINDQSMQVDFTGTAPQVKGNINCPLPVTAAAVLYVFRCLMPEQTPACAGSFLPITITAEKGCLLNAQRPAAVAAGNVETSSRIVDVILGALAQAIPERIPAASQGTMNNIAMGSLAVSDNSGNFPRWDYYETIGGGMGASSRGPGLDGLQCHMTNTLNTPVESVESHYPLRIRRYSLRQNSGGGGGFRGGEGVIREFEFLRPAQVSLLTERRRLQPWGLADGQPSQVLAGQSGENRLNGQLISGKCQLSVKPGDILSIATPGGGAWSCS